MTTKIDAAGAAPLGAESAGLTQEEISEELEAQRLEDEQRAQEEADAEEEELNSPMDTQDQEGWDDDIERLNE